MKRAIFTATTFLVLGAGVILTGQVLPSQSLLAQVQRPPQAVTPQAVLEKLFTSEQIQADWFAPEFLAQVPISSIQEIIISLNTELGTYQGVQEDGEDYLVVFERGSVPTEIVLNDKGQITGLLFQTSISLKEATEQFKALPGQVSVLVLEGQSERAAVNATTPLAVGSAFKLAVLDVLNSQIESGQHSWDELVKLQPEWKSLPSGILQNWPDGSVLTVQTLAALMISQSDNTATDHLIHLVGREAIEAITPRNRPFLTTREAFILKSTQNRELLQRYLAGDLNQRRLVLNQLQQQPLPDVSDIDPNSVALDVEWFFTAEELCSLMARVKDLPLMSINSGVADASDWQRVAYKGGSESGVLNLTTWLLAKNGQSYCVTATWNHDEPLEEERFITLYRAVIEGLKPASKSENGHL